MLFRSPLPVELSEEYAAAYDAAQEEYDRLSSEYESAEELPDDVDQRFGELEAEIERIDAMRHASEAEQIGRVDRNSVGQEQGDVWREHLGGGGTLRRKKQIKKFD